jgi:hypothetical protein
MGLVLELLRPEIEKTIKGLESKNFEPDPIAGPVFSKITSVMSSAYKRHGYILERAILETLRLCPHFEVWNDPAFQVPSAVEHIVDGSIAEPTKLIGTDYPYSEGQRTLHSTQWFLTRIRAHSVHMKLSEEPGYTTQENVVLCLKTHCAYRSC